LLTEQFLFTVHAAPSPALQHARHQYRGLDDEDARADEVRLLFLVTDVLIGSFRPQLLAIDDRLGEIQLGMLRGASPKVHDELVKILGILTDAIQELGWYAHDLEDIAEVRSRKTLSATTRNSSPADRRRSSTRLPSSRRPLSLTFSMTHRDATLRTVMSFTDLARWQGRG
jgi:Mg2+ and Co2+ transporter CorA